MTTLATKGTSWLMSIIIWILSLFGINIGGGEDKPDKKTYLYLPADTTLVTHDETYTGPCKFETIPCLLTGDTYTTKDYVYTFDESDGHFWSVKVRDTGKSSYSELQTTTKIVNANGEEQSYISNLFGADIRDLNNCFEGCSKLEKAPAIPKTVKYMINTFKGCSSLTVAPQISNNQVNMYGTFDGCPKITFADNYKTYFDMGNNIYVYITYNQNAQCWIANDAGMSNNLNLYIDMIKALDSNYAGYPINVNGITEIISNICTLKLYKTDDGSFAWEATKDNKCSTSDFNSWLDKNKLYKNIPISQTGDTNEIIEGICSLKEATNKETSSPIAQTYGFVIDEKYTSDEEIVQYFKDRNFKYMAQNVDLSGLTLEHYGYNNYNLILTDVADLAAGPRQWVWKIDGSISLSELEELKNCDNFRVLNIPVSLEGVEVKLYDSISIDFICSKPSRYNSGYWKLNSSPATSASFKIMRILYTEYKFRIAGYSVNIDGVVFEIDSIYFTACQPEGSSPYFTVIDGSSRPNNMRLLMYLANDTYLANVTNGCYSNYKLFNIPITLDGLSFENDDIVFTLHQPDKYDVDSKYFTVLHSSSRPNNMKLLMYLADDNYLAHITDGNYSNYKLFNIPITLDGLSFENDDIVFTLHQPDKYDVDSKYFTVLHSSSRPNNMRLLMYLTDNTYLANVTDGNYSNYKLFNIPVSINGLTFTDNDITYTVIQNNLKTPSDIYLKPSCDGDARVQMFKILIDNDFKCVNVPVKVDGEILADGLGGEAVFTFHQDANDWSNVWITVSAGNNGSLVTAFGYVKEYFSNGLLFDRVPIKMEGLTIQSSGYNYVYHDATPTKGEYWSVSVDIPDEMSTEEGKAEFIEKTTKEIGEYFLDIPVEIFYLSDIVVVN